MAAVRAALKKAGFAEMVEVGLGGDMTAAYEAKEWIEALREGRKMTTSCCPAFISMMHHHFPGQYEQNKSATVSPMVAVSRYLKSQDPDCVTVFIGPCIAKKGETLNENIADNADFAMTYGEMVALLDSKEITLLPVEEPYQEASVLWEALCRKRRRGERRARGDAGNGRGYFGDHPSALCRRRGVPESADSSQGRPDQRRFY